MSLLEGHSEIWSTRYSLKNATEFDGLSVWRNLQCYEVVLASYCMSCNYIFHRNRDKPLVLQKVSNKCVFVYIWYLQHFQLKLLICWLGFVPFVFFLIAGTREKTDWLHTSNDRVVNLRKWHAFSERVVM